MNTTIAALATPPGKGGIACVRISGPQALQVASRVFTPTNSDRDITKVAGYTAAFGHFVHQGRQRDETIALVFRAPKSYTGEDVVELSCHGGNAVVQELLEACMLAGAVLAGPGEFTRRAFLSGRISLVQAEAVMDLVEASNRQAAAAAEAAMDGALYRKIFAMQQKLLTLSGHIAAYTDYPEEDVEELSDAALQELLTKLAEEMRQLVQNYDKGALVRTGVATAIVGAPNVGKSTILNLLAGCERAIVTPVAGTTRDVVEQTVELDGVTLLLADTAGLRETQDVVEQEGIRRSRKQLESAGLILAVFDGSSAFDSGAQKLAEECRGRVALAIINKSDRPLLWNAEKLEGFFGGVLTISALADDALPALENAIKKILSLTQLQPEAGMLANSRQLACANTALAAVEQGLEASRAGYAMDAVGVCVQDALGALYSLTGQNVSDEVVDEVFSKFCVGK